MKKKGLIIFVAILSLLACNLNIKPLGVKADSGFDSSYDSGGSDWGSSDWDSGSSYDSDSSYGSSNYSSSSGELDPVAFLIFIAIFAIIIIASTRGNNTVKSPFTLDHRKEISDDEIKKYIESFDKQAFLKERFDDYKKVQEDWMNFNYDSLRENLTDELYNQYEMQLETLKVKNEKNIMSNITYIDSMITKVNEENKQITVTMELLVSQVDYIEQNGKMVRGRKTPMNVHYELKFVLSNKKLENCPNCGAKLKNSSSNKCEYCGSVVSKVGNKAVLSKKQNLRQR